MKDAFDRDFGMKDQIRCGSISIMNNIAESFKRGSGKGFSKFLFISRGSRRSPQRALCGQGSGVHF